MQWKAAVVIALLATAATGKVIVVDPASSVPTLDVAGPLAAPGDVIQLRKGSYAATQTLRNVTGTAQQPVVVEPYPGDHVTLDGKWEKKGWGVGVVNVDYCSWVELRNLEVCNSDSNGINVREGRHVTIRGNYVHHTYYKGIGGTGESVSFINNTIHDAVLQNNASTHPNGGWSQCMSSDVRDNKLLLNLDFLFEGNLIYDCWGEGIDVIRADGAVVRNNVVHDTFSVLIYTDNSQNVWIEGNVVVATDRKYWRYDHGSTCFLIGTENWPEKQGIPPIPTVNVTIVNNLAYGSGGIQNYREGHYYSNICVLSNTLWAIGGGVFYMPDQQQPAGVVVGNQLKNNVFYIGAQNDSRPWIASDVKSWDISSNAWVGSPDVPYGFNSTSGGPSLAFPSRDPSQLFARTCPPPAADGLIDPSCFRLSKTSPLRAHGTPVPKVIRDFFGTLRDPAHPSISFAED